MADSQRQQRHTSATGDDRKQILRERFFLITFLFGAVSLVAGMFWIADGLSSNFKTTSATFLTFAIAGGLTVASVVTSKILTRD